jgi:hypothetical protein
VSGGADWRRHARAAAGDLAAGGAVDNNLGPLAAAVGGVAAGVVFVVAVVAAVVGSILPGERP